MLNEVKKARESQLLEKKQRQEKMKEMNKDFQNKLKVSYDEFVKENEEKQLKKKTVINNYRLELDRQVREKSENLRRPLMDETEKLINRAMFI